MRKIDEYQSYIAVNNLVPTLMKIETNKINSCGFRLPRKASLSLAIIGALSAPITHGAITIDTVLVGDAGNAADTTGFGAVNYNYNIGTYEVTNSQYAAFLNAVAATDTYDLFKSSLRVNSDKAILRSGSDGNYTYQPVSGEEDHPVGFVDFWSAARFANWLTNGQPTGAQDNSTTESGAYTLTASGISNNTVSRGNWFDPSSGNTSTQTVFAVTSRDEWYKAAYFDGSGGYFNYPTGSDDQPTKSEANWFGSGFEDVGYSVPSPYGTYDQGGNQREWTDDRVIVNDIELGNIDGRNLVGGHYGANHWDMQSNRSTPTSSDNDLSSIGFRVTSLAPIPEPSTYAAIFGVLGLGIALIYRRRRN
jgi:hypothetical protein